MQDTWRTGSVCHISHIYSIQNLSLGMEYDSDEYSSDEDDLDLFDLMEEAGQTLKANAAAVGEKAAVKKTDVVQNSTELDVSSEVI